MCGVHLDSNSKMQHDGGAAEKREISSDDL